MRTFLVSLLALLVAMRALSAAESLPSPEILHFIGSAQEVYAFPYISSEHPKLDKRHLRRLDTEARDTLKKLLSDPHNWYSGLLTVVEGVGGRNVGVLFRIENDELVLFLDDITISASFHGRSYYGALEARPIHQLFEWKRRYGRPELRGQ
jgi:hypothetical protein